MSSGAKKAGVMGWPVAHSLSPRLHGYWLRQYKIEGNYVALPVQVDALVARLKSLTADGFAGVNLTVPHKEIALSVMDEIEPLAKVIGAVNTVVVQPNGKLLGRNTDAYGFTQNLVSAGFKPGKTAVMLGAGGASRAGLVALLDMGFTDIRLLNRTRDKAEKLAAEFAPDKIKAFGWSDAQALEGADLLVNATSLGLKWQPPLEIALDNLPLKAWVTDMVYAPLQTDLLKRAALRGNKTVDGLGMLLHQARPAFQAFFGVDPEVTSALRTYVVEGQA